MAANWGEVARASRGARRGGRGGRSGRGLTRGHWPELAYGVAGELLQPGACVFRRLGDRGRARAAATALAARAAWRQRGAQRAQVRAQRQDDAHRGTEARDLAQGGHAAALLQAQAAHARPGSGRRCAACSSAAHTAPCGTTVCMVVPSSS